MMHDLKKTLVEKPDDLEIQQNVEQVKSNNNTKTLIAQIGCIIFIIIMTILSIMQMKTVYEHSEYDFNRVSKLEAGKVVWSAGWIACVCTSFGMLPFLCLTELSDKVVGYCNAIAAGVMIAASIGLVAEGVLDDTTPDTVWLPPLSVLLGAYLGIGFIKFSGTFVGEVETEDMAKVDISDIRRVIVIMTAMTVHAFSEGVGIGVSYHSTSLGGLVSTTLAIHNIPEGLAVAIVLIPRGYSKLSTLMWCIFSSLPQPIMAVPAFFFVDQFKILAPIGFGFAAGAMVYVALYELLEESQHAISESFSYLLCFLAALCMGGIQIIAREELVFQE